MNTNQKNSWFNLLRNFTSYIGLFIAGISTLIGLPMMLIDILTPQTNPYTGIFTYLILPTLATIGTITAIFGAILTARRRRKEPLVELPPLPTIDLNNKSHRAILVGIFAGLLILSGALTLTAYRAYNFSDSVQFCGLSCHTVMKPEYTAYQHSPHARVACVSCHIGPGVGWFVRSKITGAYQIYSVTFHKYSKPIKTPVENLRPAQETCEQCHWPAKFFGAQQKTFTHYLLTDEKNQPWQIQMLIKIGGGNPDNGDASGIHWHMNIKNKIEYVATDDKRENIPWVRATNPQGQITEYVSSENPIPANEMNKYILRRMDCVDCHNRPSHIFNPPNRAVDNALYSGLLDASLPYLKREGVRLLSADYESQDEAKVKIGKGLQEFYDQNYPAVAKEKSASISKAIQSLQNLYSQNMFPDMKTDWRAHTNHLSHMISDGCFRCHDGLHKSTDGKTIPNQCTTCHTFLAQGSPDKIKKGLLQSQTFIHPVDLGVDVTTMKCSSCHSGTTGL